MNFLDNEDNAGKIDRSGMLSLIEGFPEMMERSSATSEGVRPEKISGKIENIMFCGMGGSAISADVAQKLISECLDIPAAVSRSYDLPRFVGKNSIVFVLSYSGNTEETISAYENAKKAGSRIICITSGGRIEELAKKNGNVIYPLPQGFPPRASMPYILAALLYAVEDVLSGCGFKDQIKECIPVLKKIRDQNKPAIAHQGNIAKQIASKIFSRIPIILGSTTGSDVAAYRWKCQFSENSKITSVANVFPEMDHNEIVNLAGLDKGKKDFCAVLLRDNSESEKIKKRIEATKGIISAGIEDIIEVWAEGETSLSRMMSLCYMGDFVSAYIALLRGVDPTPVTAIDKLKKELAG